ncbi:MAG TPA: hypothetical protein PKA55_01780 [Rhodoblastus sp.]|mgnify:FL=1|nr:hypothetical protein [Rhodoblastus sp.]
MPNTVASPVDTYARPTGENAATQFLKGLGQLAGPITTAFKDFNKEENDDAEAQAQLKALQAKPEDLRKEIENGNFYGMGQKRAQTAMRVMDAQNRVYQVSAELDAMNQRGELAGADAQGLIHGLVDQHAQAVSGDTLAAKTFTKGMVPVMRQYGTAILRQNIAQEQGNKEAQLFQYMTNLHDQVDRDAEAAPEEYDSAAMVKLHKQALFRTADFAKSNLLLSQDQMEKVLGKVAQHYASQGNVEALDAIGAYDRNGTPLSAKFGPQWDAWRKSAEAAADGKSKEVVNTDVDNLTARANRGDEKPEDFYKAVDAAHAKDPGNFGETRKDNLKRQFDKQVAIKQKAATEQLAAQQEASAGREFVEQGAQALMAGHGYMLPSEGRFTAADGKERTYTRKEYQERMYNRAEALLDEQGKAKGWSPEQVAAAKVRLYGQNGEVSPVYQRNFDDLYTGSRAGVMVNSEQLPQRLAQLEFLRNTDPGQFLNLAGQKDKQQQTWIAAYKAAREFGSNPERAYAIANQRVFNPSAQERITVKDLNDKADEVLKKFASNGVLVGPIAREKAVAALNIQMAAGVADKDIVDKAAASLSASHIIANGVPVHNSLPGVGDANVAKEYLEDAARYFKQSNPRIKDQPFSIALADDPARPGNYIAMRTDNMERLGRESKTGSEIKDYVLQYRQRERATKKRWNDWYHGLAAPKDTTPELSGD